MSKLAMLQFYIAQLCGSIAMFCVLLPWMSYGIGSKTGLDIAKLTLYAIVSSAALFLLFSYIANKIIKNKKFFLYLSSISAALLSLVYIFELIRVMYQTMIAKNLPMEMFGVATMLTAKIHIGYGLWLGAAVSIMAFLLTFIAIRRVN